MTVEDDMDMRHPWIDREKIPASDPAMISNGLTDDRPASWSQRERRGGQ